MKVSVKVPATSSNLGPAFDCIGLALPIYNTITVEETILPGTGIEINVINEGEDSQTSSLEQIPLDENNLVYKAIDFLYCSTGHKPSELKITINTQIPIAKGLGSSSSIVVGGIIAANKLLGSPADEAALISIASELEGHPDNIVPAFIGGLCISSIEEDGSVVYSKLNWPKNWTITACIPDFELSTDIARSVIPTEIPLEDALYNVKNTGLLIQAINTCDENLMRTALKDKIHQPYRANLIPEMNEIIGKLRQNESILGCVLSGAGPTLLVISNTPDNSFISDIVDEFWSSVDIKSQVINFDIAENGAQIL